MQNLLLRCMGTKLWGYGMGCYNLWGVNLIWYSSEANTNAYLCTNEVVESHIVPFLQQLEDQLFQEANASPCIVRRSRHRSAETNVNLLRWPPRSSHRACWGLYGKEYREFIASSPDTASSSARITTTVRNEAAKAGGMCSSLNCQVGVSSLHCGK